MGFFSWKCAKSEKPVMATVAVRGSPWEFASFAVVVFKDGNRIAGAYDGYGRIVDVELIDYPEDSWRMVIERYYNNETFEELSKNKYDQGQGFFYSDEDLEEIFGVQHERKDQTTS
jgi:hypothetical protein